MSLTLVFNHHALPYPDTTLAEQAIDQFVVLLGRCKTRYGLNLILLDDSLDQNWFGIEVAQGYFWRDWFNTAKQRQEMRDQVRILRNLQTRQPMFLPEDQELVEYLVEVTLPDGDGNYAALQAAYWYKTWLLSFPSSPPWNQANITVNVSEPDEEQQDLIEKACELGNLCDEQSLELHLPAIQRCVEERLQAGKEIWEQREQYKVLPIVKTKIPKK